MSAPVTPRAPTPAHRALASFATPPRLQRLREVAQAASPPSDGDFAEELFFSPRAITTPSPHPLRNFRSHPQTPMTSASFSSGTSVPLLAFSPVSSQSVAVSSSTGSW